MLHSCIAIYANDYIQQDDLLEIEREITNISKDINTKKSEYYYKKVKTKIFSCAAYILSKEIYGNHSELDIEKRNIDMNNLSKEDANAFIQDIINHPELYFCALRHKSIIKIFGFAIFAPGTSIHYKNNQWFPSWFKFKIKYQNNFFGGSEAFLGIYLFSKAGVNIGIMAPTYFNDKIITNIDLSFFYIVQNGIDMENRLMSGQRYRCFTFYYLPAKYIKISFNCELCNVRMFAQLSHIENDWYKDNKYFFPTGSINIGDQKKNNFIISFGDFISLSAVKNINQISIYGVYGYSTSVNAIREFMNTGRLFENAMLYFADNGVNSYFIGSRIQLNKSYNIILNVNIGGFFAFFSGKIKPKDFHKEDEKNPIHLILSQNHQSVLFKSANTFFINISGATDISKYFKCSAGLSFLNSNAYRECLIQKTDYNMKEITCAIHIILDVGKIILNYRKKNTI